MYEFMLNVTLCTGESKTHANPRLMRAYAMCAGQCEETEEAESLDLDPPNSNSYGTNPRL